jgi:uncharacterized protein YunC (DUF1805 family)
LFEGKGTMKIKISHARNAVLGWDIDVSAEAEAGEKIGQVEVRVNGIREVQDLPGDALDSWDQQLSQKGVYPGKNKVEVAVSDQNGNETSAEQTWS